MNTNKLWKAKNEGKLDKFLESLSSAQIKLLTQQIKDELTSYEYRCRNYSPEKMKKIGQPFIDGRMQMLNKIAKQVGR